MPRRLWGCFRLGSCGTWFPMSIVDTEEEALDWMKWQTWYDRARVVHVWPVLVMDWVR